MRPHTLRCTACGEEHAPERRLPRCATCGQPLDVVLEIPDGAAPRDGIDLFDRWRDFLPFEPDDPVVTLGEGDTPLLPSRRVAAQLGMERLRFKNETVNPTWSFKDRGTAAALARALADGADRIGTVSSGNMAVSVAAYGARAGLDTTILLATTIADEKVPPIAVHRPRIVMVDGDYGELYFRSLEAGEVLGIAFLNSDVPFRVEGSKTIALEIWEQLGRRVPDRIVVPVSAGGNFRGIVKGFAELMEAGLVDRMPALVAAQAAGCAPVASAWAEGRDRVEHVDHPDTIAHAIDNPFPPSGDQVLRLLSRYDGTAVAVTEEEIIAAQRSLASDGLFGQPAAAVPLAALRRLMESGGAGRSEEVVCVVTGAGLKYTAALAHHTSETLHCRLDDLAETLQG
jgi:threonine synthase